MFNAGKPGLKCWKRSQRKKKPGNGRGNRGGKNVKKEI